MALTVTSAGSGSSTSSSSTLSFAVGVATSVGDMLVVFVSADNAGASGAASLTSVTDDQSNVYTSRVFANRDPGAASAGVTGAVYTCDVTTALLSTDNITVNFSPNTTAKAAHAYLVTSSSGSPSFNTQSDATGATGTVSVSLGFPLSGDLIIGFWAREHRSAVTGDSDTTHGTWSSLWSTTADTGANLTSQQISSQWKVLTENAAFGWRWDATATSADSAYGYVRIEEIAGTTTVDSVAASSASAAGTANVTASTTVDPVASSSTSTSGTANVTSETVVQGVASTSTATAGTANVTASTTVDPVAATSAATSGVANITTVSTTIVDPVAATSTSTAGTANATASTTVDPIAAVSSSTSGLANISEIIEVITPSGGGGGPKVPFEFVPARRRTSDDEEVVLLLAL